MSQSEGSGSTKQNQALPFNKPFSPDGTLIPVNTVDERTFSMPCGSSVTSGGADWLDALASRINTLSWSGVPDVVTVSAVP